MKKRLPYVCSVAMSLVLCAVVLVVPVGESALWQRPCVNVYSLFGAIFLVMNTVGLWVIAAGSEVFGRKPYTKERPIIEERKRCVTPVVMAFFEAPLLLTVFFIDGGWKMAACTALYIGAILLGTLAGELSADPLRRKLAETEKQELAEQLRKEEGC